MKTVTVIEVRSGQEVAVDISELYVASLRGEPYFVHSQQFIILPVFTDPEELRRAFEAGLVKMDAVAYVDDVPGFVESMPEGVRLAVNPTRLSDGTIRCLGIDKTTRILPPGGTQN